MCFIWSSHLTATTTQNNTNWLRYIYLISLFHIRCTNAVTCRLPLRRLRFDTVCVEFYRKKWHCERFSSHRFGFRCQWHCTMLHIQPYRNGTLIRRTNGRNLGNYIKRSALLYIGGELDKISLAYFLSIYLYEPPRGFRRQDDLTGWLAGSATVKSVVLSVVRLAQ
jgi:hypothetical protein